ncbi:hypothetical protein [Deinococcus pimensis]|uniref:hypothetical protein n=1 Tax=Deinococcus pimensis TaxID=309888 RepID=UPI0004850990|nr:hypothetical protein [Deinococcus pimensis]
MTHSLRLQLLVRRAANSGTIATWFSFVSRTLSLFVVLPAILQLFSTAQINLWYLLLSFLTFAAAFDFGFSPTFVRLLSYRQGTSKEPGTTRGERRELTRVMRRLYRVIAMVALLFSATIGTLFIASKITAFGGAQPVYWSLWALCMCSVALSLYAGFYSSLMVGNGKLVAQKRLEAALYTVFVLATIVATYLFKNFALSFLLFQAPGVLLFFIYRAFVRRDEDLSFLLTSTDEAAKRDLVREVLQTSWRSGVGVIFSNGILQLSPVIYSLFVGDHQSAAYALSLRLLSTISQFSQAPFYSRIPELSQMRFQKRIVDLKRLGIRSLYRSLSVYAACATAFVLASHLITDRIAVNAQFMALGPLSVLALAFLVERFGAMHLQLYSTGNRIIWHWLNGVTGVMIFALFFSTRQFLGEYSFPLAMLIAYGLIYTPVSHYLSVCSLGAGSQRALWVSLITPSLILIVLAAVIRELA